MIKADFLYNGNNTSIMCNETDTMKELYDKFLLNSQTNRNTILFSYNGRAGNELNEELALSEIANQTDKERKEMTIVVNDIPEETEIENNKKIVKSKNIICPTCKENAKLKFKNYKITLYDCKNNHTINDLSYDEFEKSQNIDLSQIKCNKCNINNKSNSFNNQFYKCCTCNINLCPLCKSSHDTNHIILDYDKCFYECGKHKDEKYTKYCKECKKNICMLCENENEHKNHNNIYLGDLILKKNELINKMNAFNENLNKCNKNINEIINILNKVKSNINKYYEINCGIINNYDENHRNYETLYNLKGMFNNGDIIKDINIINNEKNINDRFNSILNIFDKVTNNKNIKTCNNEIKLTLEVKEEDINKEIYFLDNTVGAFVINNTTHSHQHDCLKELNDSNVELYINDIKYKYQKYFKPIKKGIYNILLKFHRPMTDCAFMFSYCKNLKNIDLSSFDTTNITNMAHMFSGCSSITNINLPSINTKKVTNMNYMFSGCRILTKLDLTSFNTENVINMNNMFGNCKNLTDLDLSSFDIRKVIDLDNILLGCFNLKKMKIKRDLYEKIKDKIENPRNIDFNFA